MEKENNRNKKQTPKVPAIIPVILLFVIAGLLYALVMKGPGNIFNISNNADNYESTIGSIKYEKDSYSCEEGTTFTTLIRTTSPKTPATVASYSSSDSNIASIDGNVEYQTNCIDCIAVRVVCKKPGSVTLSAESSKGAKTSVDLVVTQKEGTIAFSYDSYTCNAKGTFETMIKASGTIGIKSYRTGNSKIATIDDKVSSQVKCINCRMVRVVCKKKGTTTLHATATNGAKATANLTVKQDIGTIRFKENSYTCNAGEVIETMITANGGDNVAYVKSYESSNTSVVRIDDNVSELVKCINCRLIKIVCVKQGTATLKATSSTGATTTVSVKVNQDVGSIKFKKSTYSCNAGESFETTITAYGSGDSIAYVSNYSSSDTSIATIDDNVTEVPKCINCKAVRVSCKKKGSVVLSATSSSGAKTTSSLTVNEKIGTISFKKSSYSCNAGETFETLVTAKDGPVGTYVKSISSSDTNIATIDSNTSLQVNCINCRMVRVVCKKKGNVTLKATSSSGAKTSVSLTVNEKIGTISFDKPSYSCAKGTTFETIIKTTNDSNGSTYVKSYSSSDTSIATIDDNTTTIVNCINCRVVRVVCKKEGSVILSATSSSGAKTTSSLSVTKDLGSISFEQPSYNCLVGKTFETTITAYGPSDSIAYVSNYSSSDTSIATIDDNVTEVPKCINCKAVRVSCKKTGSVVLNATSSTGAKTSVNLKVLKINVINN